MSVLKLNAGALHVFTQSHGVPSIPSFGPRLKVLRVLFSGSKEETRLTMREICLSSQGIGPAGALALVRGAQHHCLTAVDMHTNTVRVPRKIEHPLGRLPSRFSPRQGRPHAHSNEKCGF